jgi:hypothetical protein
MIPKARKIKVWCTTKPTPIEIDKNHSIYDYDKRSPTCFVKHRQDKSKSNTFKIPTYVRCKDCNKRLKIKTSECGDLGCWHFYLPPHKKTIKEKSNGTHVQSNNFRSNRKCNFIP